LPRVESAAFAGDPDLVVEPHPANARIIRVNCSKETPFEKCTEGVRLKTGNGAGLNIAGRAALDADPVLAEEVEELGVFHRADAVADARGTQELDGVPDALRASRLSRMNGDTESEFADAVEVVREKVRRETGFVAGEVDGDKAGSDREKGVEFGLAAGRPERAAENPDCVDGRLKTPDSGRDSVEDGLSDSPRVDSVGRTHESGAEAELDVIEVFVSRILDVFVSDTAAVIGCFENSDRPLEFFEEFDEAWLSRRDAHMGAKALFIYSRQGHSVFIREFENRSSADVAVEMTVKVDPRSRRHGRFEVPMVRSSRRVASDWVAASSSAVDVRRRDADREEMEL
jgi:hypothetical protein